MAELQQQQQPQEGPINGGVAAGTSAENPGPSLGSKRQRRPSVRLGDIGDQPATLSYESYINRRTKQWNDPKYRQQHSQKEPSSIAGKSSKTRPLLNLGNGGGGDCNETLESEDKNPTGDGNLELAVSGNRRGKDLKSKRGGLLGGGGGGGTKRVRSNWVSKVDEGGEGDNEKFSGGDDENEWYRDFDTMGSESPLREQNPIVALENTAIELRQASDKGHGNEREGILLGQKRTVRARVSDSRDHGAVELEGPSDTDARDWKGGTSSDKNGVRERDRGRCRSLEDGVQIWLNGLGLERYAPVFEIHEVDEEVLPLLTLEDLRDMGINAVGTRRKLYCAIQKLAKGFS
ncbi:Sterile alpha motif domain [Macleaya cordata]|uniref:Sterile alpha motif domain n=1 Tax=Macleaya cordata TaxID=56857 RepID=A0A200QGS8_MACCD|nr:Sterile alpha motif domain [Macleaya cordata]